MAKGQTGGSLGGRTVESARRRKRRAKARQAEEQRWAELAGPVIVTIGDRSIYVKSERVKADLAAARAALLGQGDDKTESASVSPDDDASPSAAAPA